MNSSYMDDFGNYYPAYMHTFSCACWYVSASAYGGLDRCAGWGEPTI